MISKPIIKIAIIFVYLLLISDFWKMYRADTFYTTSKTLIKENSPGEAIKNVNRAINLNPREPAYYRGRAKSYLIDTLEKDVSEKTILKNKALADLKRALNLNPKNLATIRNSLPLYYFLSVEDLMKPGNSLNVDGSFLEVTREFFGMAKETYLNDAGVLVSVAKYEKRLGLWDDYNETLGMIGAVRPDLLDWKVE